jgi:hypothetical protein
MAKPLIILSLAAVLAAAAAGPSAAQVKPKTSGPRKTPAAKPAAPESPTPAEAPKPEPPATDVRVKTANTQGAQVSQNVTYIKGARQRVEFPGVVSIDQCDLKRSVMLNTAAKRYRLQPYPEAAPAPAAPAPAPGSDVTRAAQSNPMGKMPFGMKGGASGAPAARGGVVTMTTTLSDTLERKTMLGLEARHIKTVVAKQFTPNACDKSPLKVEVDAWYVDLPEQSACTHAAAPVATPPPAEDASACTDRVETRVLGDVKLGFPVQIVTTTTTGEGDKVDVTTSSQDVTELEITRLDKALFEVPADYVEAKSSAEIVPALANGGSLSEALFGSTVDGSSTATPKKPGIIRIGILEPVNRTTRTLPPASLRQELVAKFNKAPYEALPVAGTSPAAIDQEAARLGCDYLLVTEIVEAKTSKPGKLGGVMKMAGGGPSKDTHEVKLDYKLFTVGATEAPKVSGNLKASSGGFGVGSALRVAAFAGQMYMGMGMMGGMMGGMGGLGLMNPMMGLSRMGALGAMGGGSFFDPRAAAMSSMAAGLTNGMASAGGGAMSGDPSETELRETVSEALGSEAKTAMEAIGRKKS